MRIEDVSLLVFKEIFEKKKEMVKSEYDSSLDSYRKEAIADHLSKIDFCLKEISNFIIQLADDENAQIEKHST